MPTVSVIIATYNHADYLAQAVESVLAQRFADLELLIVDDGSTDGTPGVLAELARRHPGRFRHVRQPNAGVGAAMNRGLAQTAAPLVAFLDSDDTWSPDHLATLVPMLEKKRPDPSLPSPFQGEGRGEGGPMEAVVAFGRRDAMDEHGAIVDRPGKPYHSGRVTTELFASMFISKICLVARRDAIARAGGFDTALRMGEDYELLLRLSRLGTFAGTDAIVAHRRRHASNLTADTPAYRVRTAALLERFYFTLDGWRDVEPSAGRRRLARAHYSAARKLLAAGDSGAARFHLARSLAFGATLKARLLRLAAMMSPRRKTVTPALPADYAFIPTPDAVAILARAMAEEAGASS